MSHRWHPGRPSIKPSEEDRLAPAPPNGQVIKKTPGPGQSQRESRSAGLAAILPARHQASHRPLEKSTREPPLRRPQASRTPGPAAVPHTGSEAGSSARGHERPRLGKVVVRVGGDCGHERSCQRPLSPSGISPESGLLQGPTSTQSRTRIRNIFCVMQKHFLFSIDEGVHLSVTLGLAGVPCRYSEHKKRGRGVPVPEERGRAGA
jgi:hypothetical protein